MNKALIRRLAPVIVGAIAVAYAFMGEDFRLHELAIAACWAASIAGLVVLSGQTKLISVGHGAFFGLGAYTYAILLRDAGSWAVFPVRVLIAAIISGLIAYLFAIPATRLKGHSLAIVTLGLGVSFPQLIKRFEPLTGGSQGIMVPSGPATMLGLTADQFWYIVALLVLFVCLGIIAWMKNGNTGREHIAVGDNDLAAASGGINVQAVRVRAFTVGSMVSGIAGAMYAQLVGYLNPDSFVLTLSVALITGALIGGVNSLWGALLGGLFLQLVPSLVSRVGSASHALPPAVIYGALLILVMFFLPDGLADLGRRLSVLLRRRKKNA